MPNKEQKELEMEVFELVRSDIKDKFGQIKDTYFNEAPDILLTMTDGRIIGVELVRVLPKGADSPSLYYLSDYHSFNARIAKEICRKAEFQFLRDIDVWLSWRECIKKFDLNAFIRDAKGLLRTLKDQIIEWRDTIKRDGNFIPLNYDYPLSCNAFFWESGNQIFFDIDFYEPREEYPELTKVLKHILFMFIPNETKCTSIFQLPPMTVFYSPKKLAQDYILDFRRELQAKLKKAKKYNPCDILILIMHFDDKIMLIRHIKKEVPFDSLLSRELMKIGKGPFNEIYIYNVNQRQGFWLG